MHVKASDELLDELIAQYKDADPMESTRDFGILLALKETRMYRDTGMTPEQVAELATAHREGLLAVLPCKVGDFVYVLTTDSPTGIEQTVVSRICLKRNGIRVNADCKYDDWGHAAWDFQAMNFGKTVFLSREEAEAALKAQEGE